MNLILDSKDKGLEILESGRKVLTSDAWGETSADGKS